jgi:membrane-associated protein
MVPGILPVLPGIGPFLPAPSVPSGIWFYLLVFAVILLGAVFIITPVPENSLLLVSGAMAVNGQVSLAGVLVAAIAGAYIGYDLNYRTGRLFDLAVCRRYCPHILHEKNIGKTRALMKRFGLLSVIISRFIPLVNLPPFFAGLEALDYRWYMAVNFAGAVLWCGITVLIGYFIGTFAIVQDFLPLIFGLVLLVSMIAIAYALVRVVEAGWRKDPHSHS